MSNRKPSLMIFGFGAFGALAARLLAPHVALCICDPDPAAAARARAQGLRTAPVAEAALAEIVLFCVPVPALEPALRHVARHLHPGQIVIDCCSLKEGPARLMQALLPPGVSLIGSHPMFGPQSAAAGIRGLQVAICPLRGPWRRIAAFLRLQGLDVVVTSPADHDRQVAMTQGLTHLIAHAMARLGPAPRLRARSYALMAEGLAMVAQDAPEVFAAVTRDNPHVAGLRAALIAALAEDSPERSARAA